MLRRSHGVLWLLVLMIAVMLQLSSSAVPPYSEWSAPENMGAMLNTPDWDEAFPAFSKDGLSLYITSNRPGGEGGYDLWVAQRASKDQAWGAPLNLGAVLNTDGMEAAAYVSRDGHWLFFHTIRAGRGLELMASWRQYTRDDFGWEAPVPMEALNTESDDQSPAFFQGDESGAEFYFSSNRAGGLGSFDIYVSRLDGDGQFGAPELVRELSSPQGEAGVDISQDGLTMYLQSNRAGSKGLYDIWMSTRPTLHDPWTAPVWLEGTPGGDVGPAISPDNLTLLFNSNRPSTTSAGPHDLYVMTRSKLRGPR